MIIMRERVTRSTRPFVTMLVSHIYFRYLSNPFSDTIFTGLGGSIDGLNGQDPQVFRVEVCVAVVLASLLTCSTPSLPFLANNRHFSMAAGLGANAAPLTAMAVLEPQFTASGALEVVLATEDGNVLGATCVVCLPLLTPAFALAVYP